MNKTPSSLMKFGGKRILSDQLLNSPCGVYAKLGEPGATLEDLKMATHRRKRKNLTSEFLSQGTCGTKLQMATKIPYVINGTFFAISMQGLDNALLRNSFQERGIERM